MKKNITLLLVIMIALGSFSMAEKFSDISIDVDGVSILFENPPVIRDGRTMAPLRAIFERIGLEVSWNASDRSIRGTAEGIDIWLQLDNYKALVNGIEVTLDVSAFVIEGRTYVPVRFISESTGASVSWNGNTRTVSIEKPLSMDKTQSEQFDGYTLIEVYGGDLSAKRVPNAVVNIGFGPSRHYFSFSNQYGQVFRVIAKEIILQDDSTEPVLSTGRYYSNQAFVEGAQSPTLDLGHVIM